MRYLASLAVVATLAGCASHGVMINQDQLADFKRGVTTEQEVIAKLGRPTMVSQSGNVRIIVYSGAYAQARPATFIPVVGAFVGGSDVRASSVVFRFDGEGKLADMTSTQTNTGSGTGFAAGAPIEPVQDQPRKQD